MPDQGEIRHGATETVQWDGARWNTVPTGGERSWLDSVPGLRDVAALPSNVVAGAKALPGVMRGLAHEPSATLRGFTQGASEAATPDRVGLLALLTAGATVPAALAAAGGEGLVQGARVATDATNKPESLSDAAGQSLMAGSVPLSAAAVKAVPGAVERMGGTKNVATRVLGAGFGGYEGYRYGGIPGAVLGAVAGAKAPDLVGSKTLRALRMATGGLPEAAETEAVTTTPSKTPPLEPRPDSVISGVRLSPDAVARNIEATNLRDVNGYSHDMAGKLADIPSAGKARVANVPMGQWTITDEMLDSLRGLKKAVELPESWKPYARTSP